MEIDPMDNDLDYSVQSEVKVGNYIDLCERIIKEQERKVARFIEARNVPLEHTPGTGKTTTLTIDIAETEAVYELQGMMKVLSRFHEGI